MRRSANACGLTAALAPTELEVLDEGHKHVGHAGEGKGHYHVRIVSSGVCRKLPIKRHRTGVCRTGRADGQRHSCLVDRCQNALTIDFNGLLNILHVFHPIRPHCGVGRRLAQCPVAPRPRVPTKDDLLMPACACPRSSSSGFKSFVDPTTLHLPTNMTGVVGPNGCGKSNIIDAIRWVMGESAASRLRGDSLTDVIFSGSLRAQAGVAGDGRTDLRQLRRHDHRRVRARSTRSRSSAPSAATASPATTSTARAAAAATSPTCSSAPAWARAATRSSSRG